MRRTRWDQKPEEAIASGSRWSNQCPVDWDAHNRSQNSITNQNEQLSTPHPLDYSSDNRQREKKNNDNENNKNEPDSVHRKDAPAPDPIRNQNSFLPAPYISYISNMPHMYPSSSQNAHSSYSSHGPWNQHQQGFYSNRDFHRDHIFDMKWWEEQRQPLAAHLRMTSETNKGQEKLDSTQSAQWSFGSRVPKHNDRNYDAARRHSKYSTGGYDRNSKGGYRDLRNIPSSSSLNNRYKYDSYRRGLLPTPNFQNNHNIWRYNRDYNDPLRPQDYSQTYRINSGASSTAGGCIKRSPSKYKSPSKGSLRYVSQKISGSSKEAEVMDLIKTRKKEKKKDCLAEVAKKKALAAAANKLKQTFLAAKKKTSKKSKDSVKVSKSLFIQEADTDSQKKVKAQDLSVPKSIPKEGTSLEHDIDIKFSASEWESVGRGEGGMQNVLDMPDDQSKLKDNSEEGHSDSDSVQTINDDDSVKQISDDESEKSALYTEDEDDLIIWDEEGKSPTPIRRRHASESITTEGESLNNQGRIRRVRSYSTSQVEHSLHEKTEKSTLSSLTSNIKNMLVKQLLSMDKKSLKELVDDPKSRKAQFMMSHFMTMHRNVLSHKLNQLRFQSISSSPSSVDELHEFQSFDPENLPADILQQVREILDFEANGKAQQMWEEVSLSLSDLVCGLEGVMKSPPKQTLPETFHDSEEQQVPQNLQLEENEGNEEPSKTLCPKRLSQSPMENRVDDQDCQIVTPPPKMPAATITIPDSDNEVPSDPLLLDRDRDLPCPPQPLLINSSLNKSIPINPPLSPLSPPRERFTKPRDLSQPPPSPLNHPDRPPNPRPCTPSLSHLISPPSRPIKQSPLPPPTLPVPHSIPIRHPSSSFLPPSSPIDTKRLKNLKNKISDDSHLSTGRGGCEMNVPTPTIKVKQERPSPLMECGLCMHPPRSPHTPQCGFAFGIPPPPVALMPGSPRPLGAIPPQRPVPHLGSSGVPSIFKQEGPTASYLNLEHVNRPSSEERPKNPAPPDTANNEPPSPLPIPPPQSTLHQPPPPRSLIFTPEEPPRPPSPPPPQHSPRIKVERQTPQFICCCMRNECERSNSSRQSADFRRGSNTPQSQLCESASLRATPHSMYKYEPPFLSGLRSRTPHNGMVGMYPPVSPSSAARCLAPPSNDAVLQGLISPTHCLGIVNGDAPTATHNPRGVTVGVQTEKVVSNMRGSGTLSVTRRTVPGPSTNDQMTSTEDLAHTPINSPTDDVDTERKPEAEPLNQSTLPTSSVPDDRIASVLNEFNDFSPSGCSTAQLLQLSNHEREVLLCLDIVEQRDRELARERRRLNDVLRRIHEMRVERLTQYKVVVDAKSSGTLNSPNTSFRNCSDIKTLLALAHEDVSTNSDQVVSNSFKEEDVGRPIGNSRSNSFENQYMVSSSQEVSAELNGRSISPSEYFSNDSHPHSVQGERCTSTSLVEHKETHFQTVKDSSDSEEEEMRDTTDTKFNLSNGSHNTFRLVNPGFLKRKRINSGSTSDEFTEEKFKKEPAHQSSSLHVNSESCFEVRPNGGLKEEEVIADSSHIKIKDDKEAEEEYDFVQHNQESNLVKEEHEHLCNMTPIRKGSLSGSPQSPKMRNSSGSEHGYSLRSRGPPSDSFDFNSDSQLSKDALTQEDQLDQSEQKDQQQRLNPDMKQDENQADDELEKEEALEMSGDVRSCSSSSRHGDNDNFRKRKRKRKTRYQINKCRKKKDMINLFSSSGKEVARALSIDSLEDLKKDSSHSDGSQSEDIKKGENDSPLQDVKFTLPPPHMAAVLDLKVVGNLIFSTSVDRTGRLFDPASGVVLSTYENHVDSVTAIQVVGEPQFTVGSPRFQVITGSEDSSIHVYDGKTGVLTQRKNCSEPVRCLEYRWGYLFIGTDGGCGIKWNLKDKKLGEKIQFCGKGITRILTHIEGGRKVLLVGAKTTPIMIRDAMSGLFLRTLDYAQLTMYSGVFEGNLLYTGGNDKNICVFDYCSGSVKGQWSVQSCVSNLILVKNFLLAVCYDGVIRVFMLPKGDLVDTVHVESSCKMFICSALFRNKILIGNKNGEIVCCELPQLQI